MATKRRAKRRTAGGRVTALGTAAKAAADAGAKTIIYVHGIGNKPIASVLKCQWDRALFGFDLGERSRLAYSVNRTVYPDPEPDRCKSGDLIDTTMAPSAPGGLSMTTTAGIAATDTIGRITAKKTEQELLRSIASRMTAQATAPSRQALAALGVEAKLLPLPEDQRVVVTRRLTEILLRDVHESFFVEKRRKVMEDSVRDRIRPGGGPFVVIGHSQGSMIAYKVLAELAKADVDVPLFVTIGSPLGLSEVQDVLTGLLGVNKLAVPACVDAWLNVADPLDPVALDKRIGNDFKPTASVKIDDNLEFNKDSPRHPHSGSGYLETKPVRRAVKAAVDTSLFQPVAAFTIARDAAQCLHWPQINSTARDPRELSAEVQAWIGGTVERLRAGTAYWNQPSPMRRLRVMRSASTSPVTSAVPTSK